MLLSTAAESWLLRLVAAGKKSSNEMFSPATTQAALTVLRVIINVQIFRMRETLSRTVQVLLIALLHMRWHTALKRSVKQNSCSKLF